MPRRANGMYPVLVLLVPLRGFAIARRATVNSGEQTSETISNDPDEIYRVASKNAAKWSTSVLKFPG